MAVVQSYGWDVGGAHLKLAGFDAGGRLVFVRLLPCPVWMGVESLSTGIDAILEGQDRALPAAATMTAELADCWPDRAAGVRAVAEALAGALGRDRLLLFAGRNGFVPVAEATSQAAAIASANWYATAALLAHVLPRGLLLDIGSTTTDIVPFADGRVLARGVSDAERLAAEELIYSGVVRTPVMALCDRLPFAGASIAPMAEFFANAADIHRLTGGLPEGADLHDTADRGPKTMEASARRLLRMVGHDLASASAEDARRLAAYIAEAQVFRLYSGAARVLSGSAGAEGGAVVGAGVGRFVARPVADRLRLAYSDIGHVLTDDPALISAAADCAPAAAVGLLAAAARG